MCAYCVIAILPHTSWSLFPIDDGTYHQSLLSLWTHFSRGSGVSGGASLTLGTGWAGGSLKSLGHWTKISIKFTSDVFIIRSLHI